MQVPTTQEEAAALMREMVAVEADYNRAVAECNAEKNAVEAKFAQRIVNAATKLKIIEDTFVTFAETHAELFEDNALLKLDTHSIGYTPGNWKTELADEVTAEAVIAALEDLIKAGERANASQKAVQRAEWARFFLRTKTELDKARMLEESKRAEVLELLASVGVYITRTPVFTIRPNRKPAAPATRKVKL